MDTPIKVAVIRGDRRRGAVAEALALLAPELAQLVGSDREPVLIPDVQSPGRPWSCTHHDVLSATVDAVLAAGATAVKVVGGRDLPGDAVETLGYRAELWGRPARFVGLGPAAPCWSPVRWIHPGGDPLTARVHASVAASRCRIALATARTHETFRVGLGLASLVGVLHPEDRQALGLGRGVDGRAARPGDRVTELLESARGRLVGAWMGLRSVAGGMRLTGRERRQLAAVERATDRLAALAAFFRPSLTLVDGFSAVQGVGQRVALNTVIAGTDPVAVDAVAASILGFEPMEIAYLRQAQAHGLGTADLSRITLVGDPPVRPATRIRRHPADPLLQLAGHVPSRASSLPRPHFQALPARERERSDAHRH